MSRILRTKMFVFAAIFSIFLVFPAQAGKITEKKDPVTVQFNAFFSSEGSVKIEWRANYLIDKKFFKERPWIHPQMVSSLRLPPGMDVQGADMTMSMVGDAAPDVFWLQSQDIAKSVAQGFLMPLDDYVANWPEANERLKGPLRDLCSQIGPDGKRHVYVLPFAIASDCLLYNRRRFKEVGLTRGPRDWDEVFEFSKKLYNADVDPETGMPKSWGIGLPLEGWFFDRLPYYAGGACWKQRPDGQFDSTLDSEACVRSLDWLKKMVWEEWTDEKGRKIKGVMNLSLILALQGGGGGQPRSALKIERKDLDEAGIVGMTIAALYSGFNERVYKDPDKFGIVQFPKYPGPGGRYANKLGGQFLALKSTIKDKRVADAAWEYISYVCGEEGERERVRIFVDNGVARYVNPALLIKYGYPKQIVDQVPKDWAQAYKDVYSSAYATDEPPGMTAIENEIGSVCKQIVSDEHLDTRKALAKLQNTVSRSYMYVPTAEEMTRNRKIAFVVVIALALVMISSGALILRTQIRENLAAERDRVYTRKVPRSKQVLAWALLAPAVASVFMWQYVPVAWGSIMAFLNVQILGGSEWVGLDNFIRVAMRPLFWQAWKITVVWVFMNLAMGFAAPIILALLLSEIPKGKTLFRTLYYMPALTVGVITALLWVRFFDPTEFGMVNHILLSVNNYVIVHLNNFLQFCHIPLQTPLLQPIRWLLDPKFAMAACIIPGIWAGMGPGCIIYLAALKAVSEEQYDAADLDGAGIIQKTWHVTLPAIFPLVLINFVGAFIGAFHSSGNILVMTGGGPDHATHVMGLEIFYQGYVLANYGQTTAIAWVLGSLLIGFAVLQMKIFARMKFSTAEQGD